MFRISSRKLKSTIKLQGQLQRKYQVIHHPSKQSPCCAVPSHISKPQYILQAPKNSFKSTLRKLLKPAFNTEIKNAETIKYVRESCRIGRRVLNHIKHVIRVGMTTADLDYIAHSLTCDARAYPSPLGYKGYPKSICTSVNNVIVHGIPDDRNLLNGDIVNVDVTVYSNGVHGDLSETFLIGEVDATGKHLVEVTRECLKQAISLCGPGQPFNAIGNIISNIADQHDLTVCPHFVGHGIGEEFHEPPQVLHHRNTFGGIMRPGMIFTIEPVICEGSSGIVHWDDGWTVISSDDKRSAQFEHTVLITDHGVEVLTTDRPDDCYLNTSPKSITRLRELFQDRNLSWIY